MKFLALREAIEKVEKQIISNANDIIREPKLSEPEKNIVLEFLSLNFSPDRRRQTVVGGRISRDPINKQAAMIIRKAPWWAKLADSVLQQERKLNGILLSNVRKEAEAGKKEKSPVRLHDKVSSKRPKQRTATGPAAPFHQAEKTGSREGGAEKKVSRTQPQEITLKQALDRLSWGN